MNKINFNEIPIIDEARGGYYQTLNGKREFIKMSDFFPTENYQVPKGQSNYMKFQDGLNRIRILSSAIIGYEYFNKLNKPVRSKEAPEDLPDDIKEGGKVKHFWAFVVWNYQEKSIQILEITQKTIMKNIKSIIDNPKWGNPKMFDIAITKTGESLETEYSTQAEPPIEETSTEILEAYQEKTINLEALYSNGDPFAKTN